MLLPCSYGRQFTYKGNAAQLVMWRLTCILATVHVNGKKKERRRNRGNFNNLKGQSMQFGLVISENKTNCSKMQQQG